MSAPRNGTPTPHRGLPVTPPFEPFEPTSRGRAGSHRLVEGETPAQFRVSYLLKAHAVSKGLRR